MMYISLLVSIFFAVFSAGAAQDVADPEFCNAFDVLTEVTKEENQVEAVSTILDDISPGISEALKLSLLQNTADGNDSNSSIPSMPPLQVAYNTLAQSFEARPTVAGYSKFVEAVNEISLAQAEACNDPSFVPTPELISKLAEEFSNSTFGPDTDLSKARLAFGKLLCLNTRESTNSAARRRRQSNNDKDCECSNDVLKDGLPGLGKAQTVCEFFVCLQELTMESTKALGPVFGFENATERVDECLAFVIDTTGSMGPVIDAAKQIILNFVASEDNARELQCYVLVPFNDYDSMIPPRRNFGPITTVYTSKEVGDLVSFVEAVKALEPHGGGDLPEYALDGMLAGLLATALDTNAIEIPIMTPGSQMIVLTDAETKNESLEVEVINEANNRNVCVHFLIANNNRLTNNYIYQRIADRTSGTILEFSDFTFSNFVATYRQNPCNTLTKTQKRSISKRSILRSRRQSGATNCKNFYISSFAYLMKLSIEATIFITVRLTRPNGTVSQEVASSGGLVVYSEAMPAGGQWKVCVNSGTLKISLSQEITFDTSILFINEGSEMPSTVPPPLCTSSRIALLSLQADNIAYASLDFVSSDGNLARHINLIKCRSKRLFVSDVITFSEGTYDVQLTGHDIHGVEFTQATGHTLVFDSSNTVDYELTSVGEETLEMKRNETLSFIFRLRNPSMYSTSFHFASSSVRGFDKQVTPISAVVPGRQSVEIMFTLGIDPELSSSINTGSTYKFALFASNGCASYSISRTVMVTN